MTPGSSRQGPFRKPKADVLTVLLVLALAAIITGCILLYLEVADYGTEAYTRAESVVGQPAVAVETPIPSLAAMDTACPSRGGSLALPDRWTSCQT